MNFNNNKAIYLQMADWLCDEILAGRYSPDERIPSVREYAAKLGVNANTAVKTYDELARDGIIYNKRGLGYFVSSNAQEHIRSKRREEFFRTMLPEVKRQMKLLNISTDEIIKEL